MTLLPAIPALMLGAVLVWFIWPNIVDLLARRQEDQPKKADSDTIAEDLFEVWRKHRTSGGMHPPGARG